MITYNQVANLYSILGARYWSIDAGPKEIAEATKRLACYDAKNVIAVVKQVCEHPTIIAPRLDDIINEVKKLELKKPKDNITLMMSETAKQLRVLAEKRKAENKAETRE